MKPDSARPDQGPDILASDQIYLSAEAKKVLREMFKGENRLTIEKAFGRSFSGSQIFLIHRAKAGRDLLPDVVKIAPVGLIQQEWQAYELWVKETLINIARIEEAPTLPAGIKWGGLRYKLMGGSIYSLLNLSDYCLSPETGAAELRRVLEQSLLKELHSQWWLNSRPQRIMLQADYDEMLPINLWLRLAEIVPDDAPVIAPGRFPFPSVKIGDAVRLQGFVITEIDYQPPALTLNLPTAANEVAAFSFRLRINDVSQLENYQVGQVMADMPASVDDTRHDFLMRQAQQAFGGDVDFSQARLILPGGLNLPNPLKVYQTLLQSPGRVKIGPIHGDLNLENILVVDHQQVSLIDFATAREGHILHDLLRLETDTLIKVVVKVLAEANLPATTIHSLYRQLRQANPAMALNLPYPGLEKPSAMLLAIRAMARKCLLNPDDWREYDAGLTLYLVGALKFIKTFRPPAFTGQVLLLGAATAVELMNDELPLLPPHLTSEPGTETARPSKGEEAMPDKKVCPFCGEQIQSTAKKCRFCGEFLSPPMGDPGITGVHRLMNSPINIGGNLVTGDRNISGNRNIIGDRNIEGGVTISGNVGGSVVMGDQIVQATPPKTPIAELIKRAKNLLGQTNYKQAVELCEQVLAEEPEHPEANLLAAIALMHGRGADQLRDNTIERIENHLQTALDEPATEATALAILGIVKYDHYIANGLLAGKPSLKEIKERLQAAGGIEAVEARLLNLVKASSTVRERLGLFSTE